MSRNLDLKFRNLTEICHMSLKILDSDRSPDAVPRGVLTIKLWIARVMSKIAEHRLASLCW